MTGHPATQVIDVVCSTCGTEHAVRSTAKTLSADICSACHPAYTGVERTAAGGSRIERFNRRRSLAHT